MIAEQCTLIGAVPRDRHSEIRVRLRQSSQRTLIDVRKFELHDGLAWERKHGFSLPVEQLDELLTVLIAARRRIAK